jgi:N-acetylglucosamine kinase-like BadF-type ATPase
MDYVLGIDAGGSKTVCLLADAGGRVLSEARAAGANLSTAGELAVEKTLHQVMEEAIGDRPITPAVIGLGMAGVDRPSDDRIVRAIMRRIGFKARIVVANDALVALVAGAGDGPGVVMIAGTGSIVYGRNAANRAARAGGWGHVLADEGSGYWIGRRALAAVMRQGDGRGPATALTRAVLDYFHIARPTDLVRVVYSRDLPLATVAAVAPLVEAAREGGDPLAAEILARAADELILSAQAVIRRLDLAAASFPFLLSGGIFVGLPWLTAEIGRRVPAIAPGATVQRLAQPPAFGAVRLAIAELSGGASIPVYV